MKNIFAEKLLQKVAADYNVIASNFSASRPRVWPLMERFTALAKNGDRVIDVGCGNGRAYQLFADRAIEYEGVDVSEQLIAIAREKVRDQLATFRVGSALKLPFENASFDTAFSFAMIHHIPSRERRLVAFREVRRVLKPGGVFVLTSWDLLQSRHAWRVLLAAVPAALGLGALDIGDAYIPWLAGGANVQRYCHAFTLRGLQRLATEAGFLIQESGRSGGNLYIVARGPIKA